MPRGVELAANLVYAERPVEFEFVGVVVNWIVWLTLSDAYDLLTLNERCGETNESHLTPD